ncbi:MAG: endonuclease III, partial [Alphaproteobacteria bacterium]|nr:endonuclease III [Alphaproteobacteria bacterium]
MITPQRFFEIVPKNLNMDIRSELVSTNDFTFAVAVILSAQATDKKVNEVTPALFRIAPTPQKMLALGLDGLKKHIKVISFFNNKAKNIIALSEQLADIK